MSKPFPGYTTEEAAAIRQTLPLLPGIDWPRLLEEITEEMTVQYDPVVYQSEATRRITRVIDALKETESACAELGADLQLHFDNMLLEQGLTTDAVCHTLEAAQMAATNALFPGPHVTTQTTGTPKHHVKRRAIHHLLNLFEQVTGMQPKVYTHHEAGYAGKFYPFAMAVLTPVFPNEKLRSIILATYKEWRKALKVEPSRLAKKK
jgi:hypothetical protein